MPIYASDSDDQPASTTRLFSRERPMHAILGGGKGKLPLCNSMSPNVLCRKTAALVKY